MRDSGSSFLAKLGIALGIALTVTVISVGLKRPVLGSSDGLPCLTDASPSSFSAAPANGFSFKAFGYRVLLPEYAPGYAPNSIRKLQLYTISSCFRHEPTVI